MYIFDGLRIEDAGYNILTRFPLCVARDVKKDVKQGCNEVFDIVNYLKY